MAEPDPHKMMTCPYNKAHQVEHYRLHIHLQKCRKQYPNRDKVTCPFDATHVVNDVELDYHVNTCPKRILFDVQKNVVKDDVACPVNKLPPPVVQAEEESWDDENVISYQPDLSKKGGHIIMKAKGLTPAERRKVRMEGIKTYRPPEAGNSNK